MATSPQTMAEKVWEQVKAAKSMSDAARILQAAVRVDHFETGVVARDAGVGQHEIAGRQAAGQRHPLPQPVDLAGTLLFIAQLQHGRA